MKTFCKQRLKKVISIFLVATIIFSYPVISRSVYASNSKVQVQTFSPNNNSMAVILNDGTLWMWGTNEQGQLGNGTTKASNVPNKVMDHVKSVCGDAQIAVIKTDGSLWTWGRNFHGELGDGTTKDRYTPKKIMDNVVKVSTGEGYTAAIKTDGSLWTWGSTFYGVLGHTKFIGGRQEEVIKPKKVMNNVVDVGTGYDVTAALKTDGTLWTWGSNWAGQLGNGTTTFSDKPIKVMKNVTAICIGNSDVFAIQADGSLWSWGSNRWGQLGDGTDGDGRGKPTKIMDKVVAVSAGFAHVAAIKTDGSLWTWGMNDSGQLGDGSDGSEDGVNSLPKKVMEDVIAVNAGYGSTAVLQADGSLWTCGSYGINQISHVPLKTIENVALGNGTPDKAVIYAPDDKIKVQLNNNVISFSNHPIQKDGEILVCADEIFKNFGVTFKWDKTKQSIIASKDKIKISMQIGFNYITRNGAQTLLEVPPHIVNGKVYVPLKGVANAFGASFEWNENNQTAFMKILSTKTTAPYIKYEEKMKKYGLDQLYNNRRATTGEQVTILEALKLAFAVTLNITNISEFFCNDNEVYDDSMLVDFALRQQLIKENIEPDRYDQRAKYIDVINYFEKFKLEFLEEIPIKDTAVDLFDIAGYSDEEQVAIKDMLASQIINLTSENLNGNEYIFKGQINEIIVNFFERYNTSTKYFGEIETEAKKMPANADLYPYILSNVDNSVYELPFYKDIITEGFMEPKEFYLVWKSSYQQINQYCNEYFDAVLNVDYRTFTAESFKKKLLYIGFEPEDYFLDQYVSHIKKNKIIIEGSATVQMPIIYDDGMNSRVRIKVNFTVKSSNSKKNLLYLDFINGHDKTYSKTKYDLIIDYYLGYMLGGTNTYPMNVDFYRSICIKKGCGITEEEEK